MYRSPAMGTHARSRVGTILADIYLPDNGNPPCHHAACLVGCSPIPRGLSVRERAFPAPCERHDLFGVLPRQYRSPVTTHWHRAHPQTAVQHFQSTVGRDAFPEIAWENPGGTTYAECIAQPTAWRV